jgi:hypothetical protein
MGLVNSPIRMISLTSGVAVALMGFVIATPASAQYGCPPGYVYSYGGCALYSPVYGAPYGAPGYAYPYAPYAPFGLTFGFGGRGWGGGHRGGWGHR